MDGLSSATSGDPAGRLGEGVGDGRAAPPLLGQRRVTESQLRATTGLTGQFGATTPGRVLAAFKAGASALGLSRRLVDLIDVLMGYTRAEDWQGAWKPVVWPSNAELADRLCLEVSRVKALVRAALDAGLMLPVDHGTRKRFGKRDPTGRILYAYGFDLSPLGERVPAFQRAAAEFKARREEAKALRRECSRLRAEILGMADYAAGRVDVALDAAAVAQRARELADPARSLRDPLALAPVAARLRTLRAEVKAALAASVPATAAPAAPGESNPEGPVNRPHSTPTNHLPIGTPMASDARRPTGEGSRGGKGSASQATGGAAPNALRGFPITPAIVLQIAPAFRDYTPTSTPTWPQISEAACEVRSLLGISQHAYGQACVMLGRTEAAVAVAAISAKHDAGLVKSPGGLLRHMVDAHQKGTLRLDRTLFGLVDGAGGLRRERSRPASSRGDSGPSRRTRPT